MWDVSNSVDGPLINKSMNKIPHQGAKSAHSEMRGSSQQSLSVNQNIGDCHSNLADSMQKKDSQRYGKDIGSSLNTSGGFMPNNNNNSNNNNGNWQRNVGNNGGHPNSNYFLGANSESNSYNKGSSFGAQCNNPANIRAKNQVSESGYCGNGNNNSPYAAWPGLSTSNSASNGGWNFPNNIPKKSHDMSSNSSTKDGKDEENMSTNGESYSDMMNAANGSENNDNKQTPGNRNNSWGPSHLGMIGSGENSVNSGANAWNGGQNNSGTSSWENNRQMSGSADCSTENSDMSQNPYTGLVGATGGSDLPQGKPNGENSLHEGMQPPRLGLLGGGEGSMNAVPSGWGGPGPSGSGGSTWVGRATGGNCDLGDGNGSGMSPQKPQHSWAQAAGKGLNPCGMNGGGGQMNTDQQSHNTSSPEVSGSDQKAPEPIVLTESKMKAATSEGWGQMSVNQDSPWDVPPSPPPAQGSTDLGAGAGGRENSTQVWRTPVNNGTDIWQNNLNKVTPTPVSTAAPPPPWGRTPATNIGGYWDEVDESLSMESEDFRSMWNEVGSMKNKPMSAPWPDGPQAPQNAMWNSGAPPPPVDKQWIGGNPAAGSWNDGGDGTAAWNPPSAKQRNVGGNWSPSATPKKEVPPSGGWEMSPPQNRRAITGGFDDGTGVWGNPQRQGKVSNWKDMPPAKPIMNSNGMTNPGGLTSMPMGGGMQGGQGMIRLPTGAAIGSKNDAGAPWNRSPSMNRNPGWQDMPSHDGPNIGTWGEDAMHMPNVMKNITGANSSGGPFGGWNDQNPNPGYWANKPKGPPNWADGQVDTSSWLGPLKQGGKPLSRDLIWCSKQFRILLEMGYKKDDVENALRNSNMSMEEALYELRNVDPSVMVDLDSFSGRKVRSANPTMPDDMSMNDNILDPSFGGNNFHGANNFQSSNFQNMGPFKPQCKVPNNLSGVFNNTVPGQNNVVANFTMHHLQKMMQQQSNLSQSNNSQMGNRSGAGNQVANLRHIVQQIQMAVQAGHINPQIFNQALGPQTLQLLCHLLQHIKTLHQLQQQLHPKGMAGGGPNNNVNAALNVQLTQTKQRILNLQNQIAAQQALFLKGQPMPNQNADIFKPPMENMPSLQSEFQNISLKEVPLPSHQQSRLSQWKLPAYEKEDSNFCGQNTGSGTSSLSEFSRAPGPLPSKNSSASSTMPNPGPNLHPLLSQGDSTWSSLSRPQGESGWPETASSLTGLAENVANSLGGGSSAMENKESSNTPPSSGPSTSSASHSSYNLTDLVQEFEPGKPWKGTQLKNIEDDPHITPGSITRSPLSVNTIKDPDLFWNAKSSPATSVTDASSTLASSTWNFTPSQTTVSNSSNNGNKSGGAKWSSETGNGSDVWGASSKSRGPPPGISAQGPWDRQNSSNFLFLRNLTPQIDGSTLKTLCMQHGPLQMFHLSLNHGIALARYSTREEATKAQSALNNCVLGNTTILADIPNETEVQQILLVLTNQNSAGNMGWPPSQSTSNSSGYRNGNNSTSYPNSNSSTSYPNGNSSTSYPFNSTSGGNTSNDSTKLDSTGWSGNNLSMHSPQLWAFPNTSNALWGPSQPLGDHDPTSNSSLNRFLPDNLLGNEPM